MTRIAVVDYGAGNLVSIEQALATVGARVSIADSPDQLAAADGLIVPGVGAAGPAMERLRAQRLVEPIREWIAEGRPFLGICLGLQLLFEASDEDGAKTLAVLRGRTRRLANAPTLPHIGWNQVSRTREHSIFEGIEPDADFYFVHSFAGELEPGSAGAALATTQHGDRFVSAVAAGALVGVQFHPERSGDDGLRLLANFTTIVAGSTSAGAAAPAGTGALALVAPAAMVT